MRFSEIAEGNLKLLPGEIARMRGSYGALVITMTPENFLRLTASPSDYERIAADIFPVSQADFESDGGSPEKFGRFSLPFLTVEYPSGKVIGHEGRHRALMILRQGGKNFPVVIFLRTSRIYMISYKVWDEDDGDKYEQFADISAAQDRKEELKRNPDIYRVRLSSEGADTIKGSPSFNDPSDPWKKKAFSAKDMPAQLVSQYSDDVVVTNYKIGIVKGYRHFRA